MKDYIKQTEDGRLCTHPKVKKFWEWGGGPINGPFTHYVELILLDGTACEFKADASNYTSALEQTNNFLNTIPE